MMNEPTDLNADCKAFAEARMGTPRTIAIIEQWGIFAPSRDDIKALSQLSAQLEHELSSVTQRLAEMEARYGSALDDGLRKSTMYNEVLERAESQSGDARKALQELVRLKDLKDSMEQDEATPCRELEVKYGRMGAWMTSMEQREDEYRRCKPLAWTAARAVLASLDTKL